MDAASGDRPLDGPSEACSPERRRVLRVVEALNLAFLAVDLALRGAAPGVLVGRLAVAAGLLGFDLAVSRRCSLRALRVAFAAAAVVVVAGFALLAASTGGAASPYATFLAFLAIVAGLFVPDQPVLNVAIGAASAAAGLALAAAAGATPASLGFVLLAHASCTFYGAASAALHRRMRARERAAWSAQADAAAALARSELRRAAGERAAAVGRLAGELGHELSSPVASAAANLRFVEEELPRTGADRELVAAVHESREALERVGRLVGDLRLLSPDEATGAGEVELSVALEHGLQLAAARLGGPAAVAWTLPLRLPRVQASPRQLSQVVALLVALLAEAERDEADRDRTEPVALEVALATGTVTLAFTGRARPRDAAPGPERAGVGLALCRELSEPWGGRVSARPVAGGRVELALTLRAGAAIQ